MFSKTDREDSLSQDGGEIQQKYTISVEVNTTLRVQVLYHPLPSLCQHREYEHNSGASTGNGAVIRMDSPWTAHALWRS